MSESSNANSNNEIKDTEDSSQNKNIEINNIESLKGKNIKQNHIQLEKEDEKKKKEDNEEQKENNKEKQREARERPKKANEGQKEYSEERKREDNEGKKKVKEEREKPKEDEEEQNEILEKEKTNMEKISLFSQNSKIMKAFIDEDFSSLDDLGANIVIFALNDEIFGEKLKYEKEELNLLGGLRDDMKVMKEKMEKIDVMEAILREVAKKIGINPDNINYKIK